jgi:hypothetical protein
MPGLMEMLLVSPVTAQRRVEACPFSTVDGSASNWVMFGFAAAGGAGCSFGGGGGGGGGAGAFFLHPAAKNERESASTIALILRAPSLEIMLRLSNLLWLPMWGINLLNCTKKIVT